MNSSLRLLIGILALTVPVVRSGTNSEDFMGYSTVDTSDEYSMVVFGLDNVMRGDYNFIGAGQTNTVGVSGDNGWSFVGGGRSNKINKEYSSIVGGTGNTITDHKSVIGGGETNEIHSQKCSIGGGRDNVIDGDSDYSTIAGGDSNSVKNSEKYQTIGGGWNNYVDGASAVVAGGEGNSARCDECTISGGKQNVIKAGADYAFIGGGRDNTVEEDAEHQVIGGGLDNSASGSRSFIGGGEGNTATGEHSVIPGGELNFARGAHSFAVGVFADSTHARSATFGFSNADCFSQGEGTLNMCGTVYINGNLLDTSGGGGGGSSIDASNSITGTLATIAGGYSNSADGDYCFVGGGYDNTSPGDYSVVAGGRGNTASGLYAVVSGGGDNANAGDNIASGAWSFIGGGRHNTVQGADSVALGSETLVTHDDAAVFGFDSAGATCSSQGAGTINFCANAGIYVNGQTVDLVLLATNTAVLQTEMDAAELRLDDAEDDLLALNNDISTNAAVVASVESSVFALEDIVDANTGAINLNTGDISTLGGLVVTITSDISALTSLVNTNTGDIAKNEGDIGTHALNISTLAADVRDHAASIANVGTNTANIGTNTANIAANTAYIATNTLDIASNAADIATNANSIATNVNDIAANAANIVGGIADIAANTLDIASNVASITDNANNITALDAALTSQVADISANTGNIATLSANVATNILDIASNVADIATNTNDITTNANNLATNTLDIASNAADIATNTNDIATNANDIATNAANVAANAGTLTSLSNLVDQHAVGIGDNADAIEAMRNETATLVAASSANSSAVLVNTLSIIGLTESLQEVSQRVTTTENDVVDNAGTAGENTDRITALEERVDTVNETLTASVQENEAAIQSNAAARVLLATEVDQNLDAIQDLQSNLALTDAAVSANAGAIADNADDIAALATDVSTNTNAIAGLASDVTANQDDIQQHDNTLASLRTDVDTAAADVEALQQADAAFETEVDGVTARVERLEMLGIENNTAAVELLHADVDALEEAVGVLETNVTTFDEAIEALAASLATLEALDIAILQGNATDLQQATLELAAELAAHQIVDDAHDTELDGLRADVDQNAQDIDSLNATSVWLVGNASAQKLALDDQRTALEADLQHLNTSFTTLVANTTAHLQQQLDEVVGEALPSVEADVAALNGTLAAWKARTDNATAQQQQQLDDHADALAALKVGVGGNKGDVATLNATQLLLVENATRQQAELDALHAMTWTLEESLTAAEDATDARAATVDAALAVLDGAVAENTLNVTALAVEAKALEARLDAVAAEVQADNAAAAEASAQQQSELNALTGRVGDLEAYDSPSHDVHLQQQIDSLTIAYEHCNATNDNLTATVGELREDVRSLTQVVASLLEAAAFTMPETTEEPCGVLLGDAEDDSSVSDLADPCPTSLPTTPGLPVVVREDAVEVTVCYEYPCATHPDVGRLAWDRPLIMEAAVTNETLATTPATFTYELVEQTSGEKAWRSSSSSRFAEVIPAEIPVDLTPGFYYDLHVDVHWASTSDFTSKVVYNVSFVAPPILHTLDLSFVSGSPAQHVFNASVNATTKTPNSEPLTYSFSVVGFPDGEWLYEVAGTQFSPFLTFSAPSTRDFSLEVTVTNAFGSSSQCAIVDASTLLPNGNTTNNLGIISGTDSCPVASMKRTGEELGGISEVVDDIVRLLQEEDVDASVFVAGLDLLGNIDEEGGTSAGEAGESFELLFELFQDFIADAAAESDSGNSTSSVDADVLVLDLFVDLATNDDGTIDSSVLAAIAAVGGFFGSQDSDDTAVDSFLSIVDEYAGASSGAVASAAALDNVLGEICEATQEGEVPSGEVTTFEEENFQAACARVDTSGENADGAVVEGDSVSITVPGVGSDEAVTVTLTTWEANDTNETTFLSSVQGVTLTDADGNPPGETTDVDAGIQIEIQLEADALTQALRRSVSCSYYNPTSDEWSTRGVVLRGIDFTDEQPLVVGGIVVAAICVSSHLTVFTLADESEAAQIVEDKVNQLADRFKALDGVNLAAGDDTINPIFPSVFTILTVVFIIGVILSYKLTDRDKAIKNAREVFVSFGALNPPSVIGGNEYEAIVRGKLPFRDVVWLALLDVFTVNAFLSLFFTWSHEAIVFTRADKSFVLYTAIMTTFLVEAFFFEDGEDTEASFWGNVLDVFISSMAAKILLFPEAYFLPYMISNVNSFETFTTTPKSLIRVLIEKAIARAFPCIRGKKKKSKTRTHDRDLMAHVIATWQGRDTSVEERRGFEAAKSRDRFDSAASDMSFNSQASDNYDVTNDVMNDASALKRHNTDVELGALDYELTSKERRKRRRRMKKTLRFTKLRVKVPRVDIHVQDEHEKQATEKAVQAALVDVSEGTMGVLKHLQTRVRGLLHNRRDIRSIEFDAWNRDCRTWRHTLSAINYIFLAILCGFTFGICLLMSSAFSDEEITIWMSTVVESIFMQIFVTDVLIGLTILSTKIFVTWVLLRVDRKKELEKQEAKWQAQEESLALNEEEAEEEIALLDQELAEAQADGESDAETNRVVVEKLAAKERLLARLARIRATKEKINRERIELAPSTPARPRRVIVKRRVKKRKRHKRAAISPMARLKANNKVDTSQMHGEQDEEHSRLMVPELRRAGSNNDMEAAGVIGANGSTDNKRNRTRRVRQRNHRVRPKLKVQVIHGTNEVLSITGRFEHGAEIETRVNQRLLWAQQKTRQAAAKARAAKALASMAGKSKARRRVKAKAKSKGPSEPAIVQAEPEVEI